MNNIEKVSDITVDDVAEYLRLVETSQDDINTINLLIETAKTYIKNFTGRTDLDVFQDFVIVVLILCQDMWDNRTLYVDSNNTNKVVDTILGMHQINLLPRDLS